MAIFKGSRYDGALVTQIKSEDGTIKKFIHDGKRVSPTILGRGSAEASWEPGDELDMYAFGLYSNELLWWVIADVNEILFPMQDDDLIGSNTIKVGKIIQAPPVNSIE